MSSVDEEKFLRGHLGFKGKSAYEIACELGFQGTKEEWLDWIYNYCETELENRELQQVTRNKNDIATLVERFERQIENMTLDDPSSAEIVDARGIFDTLRERLENEINIPAGSVIGYDGNTVPAGYEEIGDYITTQTFSGSITVDANTGQGITIDMSKTGYKLLGIVQIDYTGYNLGIEKFGTYVSNNKDMAYIGLRNFTSSSITTTYNIKGLYVKV